MLDIWTCFSTKEYPKNTTKVCCDSLWHPILSHRNLIWKIPAPENWMSCESVQAANGQWPLTDGIAWGLTSWVSRWRDQTWESLQAVDSVSSQNHHIKIGNCQTCFGWHYQFTNQMSPEKFANWSPWIPVPCFYPDRAGRFISQIGVADKNLPWWCGGPNHKPHLALPFYDMFYSCWTESYELGFMIISWWCVAHQMPSDSSAPRNLETSSSGGDPVHGRLSRARVYIVTRRINGGYQYILLWDIFGADNFLQAWWSVPTFTSLDKIGTKHKTGVVSRFIPRFPRWDRNLILRYPEAKERPSCLASSTTPRGSGKMGLELRRTAGLGGGPWAAWSIRQKVRYFNGYE